MCWNVLKYIFFFLLVFRDFSYICIAQTGPLLVAASQSRNDWHPPLASERWGHTAPSRSGSSSCKQTCEGGGAKQVRHENQNSQAEMKSFLKHVATTTGCKSAPRLNSLSDGADSKLPSDAAVGSCSPRHGVIFQLFPPFIKVSLCGSVFIQEAIVLVLLERKGHSSLAANHTAS